MHFIVTMVTALSMLTGHDCGAVDTYSNTGAWTERGQAYSATYQDRGDYLKWNSRGVPRYVRAIATYQNIGSRIRVQCLH